MNSIPSPNSLKNKTAGKKHHLSQFTAILVVGIAVVGLSPLLLASAQGNLEVRLKDHREAIGDFLRLDVSLDMVRIHPKAAPRKQGWLTLKPVREKIDLTKYTERHSASIFDGKVSIGSYDAIDLKLKEIEGILKKSKAKMPVTNLLGPIRLMFSLEQKEATLIVLDLAVMDMSDQPGRGYELHIKGYELYTGGQLMEKVPPG
ncbi:MAG: DUF4382 domain-containing protein [Candidatus Binatia bacterium]